MQVNQIICGDCCDVLSTIPDNTFDLIFADPPYNLQLQQTLTRPDNSIVDGVDDHWDKFSSFAEYDEFCQKWLTECRRTLRDDGTIWVIGSYHNIFRIGKMMMDMGFWILNDVQWYKKTPMPNFRGVRFTNSTETLLWCKKISDQKKYTFNYQLMKELNGGKQMKSVWEIGLCTGKERLRDANGNKLHSTQKPQELLRRVILSSSKEGDLILDPFSGSGTTATVAKTYNRNFIGIEKEQKYVDISLARLQNSIQDYLL